LLFKFVYEISPKDIWKSADEMRGASNIILGMLIGLIVSVIYVAVYDYIEKGIPGVTNPM